MSGDVATPNDLLRRARLGLLSSSGSGRRLSRAELAKAVNARVGSHYRIDANYVGKLERGLVRSPNAVRRQALREILGAVSDAELGFASRGQGDDAYISAYAAQGSLCVPLRLVAPGTDLVQAGAVPVAVVNLPLSYTVEGTESGGVRLVVQIELANSAAPDMPGEEKSA
jgi:hypothetical protein